MAQPRKPKPTSLRLGFDIKVQHRDPKTGEVTKEAPYKMICSKENGTVFVRDGIKYHPDGTPHDGQESLLKKQPAKKPAKKDEGEAA